MTRKRQIIFGCLISATVCLAGCFKSKTEVEKVPTRTEIAEGRKPLRKLDGVPYRLPRTVVQVSLPVKKVEQKPGPFVKFAPCFFNSNDLGDLITEESTKYGLQSPAFSTLGEPDPEASYVVKIKGGYFENKSLLMDYTPTGILTKGEAESKDESLEFTLKAIKTATSIAGALAGARFRLGEDIATLDAPQVKERSQQSVKIERCFRAITSFKHQSAENANQEKEKARLARLKADAAHLTEATEKYAAAIKRLTSAQQSRNDAHLEECQVLKVLGAQTNYPCEANDKTAQRLVDDYQQAEEAFAQVIAMQQRRETLVSEPANVNRETFNRLLEETDQMIAGYKAAFLGFQTEKIWKGVFVYRPTKFESQLSLPFFAYSSTAGLCEIGLSANQGQHVPPAFKNDNCDSVGSLKGVWLLVQKDQDDDDFHGRIASANSESQNSEGKRGWYYRIPAKAVAYLMTAKLSDVPADLNYSAGYFANERSGDARFPKFTEIARSDISVAQLGIIASMPASAAGRANQASITLDETTGALRNFKYSSTSLLEKSMLEDVEGASKNIIDAKDPLKKKKRELDMLKTEKDIRDAKKALENNNSSPPQ